MSETYEIYTPNGLIMDVYKDTIKSFFQEVLSQQAYTEEYSKAFEAITIKKLPLQRL
ncbi:hypothetical protein [Campylobacter jejuni]|uniref:hypothetical protein n=1 Tax=Campylobacter jejuni TaxID=197 RepID=UPI00207C005E|nr:hypothetical protein [Campylobacter jejuni]